jgi:arylsulfatase A-like enzyme
MNGPKKVLFITADQWRGDSLSAVGHPCVETPNLDRLAAGGVLFRRHYSQATPCGPGRASLYTGLYLHNHRSVVNGAPLDLRHSNVALEARKAGYDPVLFGYTDVSADPRAHHPGDPVLTNYEGLLPGMTPVVMVKDDQKPWLAHLKAKGYQIPAGRHEVFRPQRDYPGAEARGPTFVPALYRAEDSNTAFLTDEVIKYISVREAEPWFVHLSYLAPHPPFVVPAPYHDRYDPADVPPPVRAASPDEEARQHPWLDYYLSNPQGTAFTVGYTAADNLKLAESDLRQLRATYYAMMSEVDDQIGRLMDHLAESGELDDTLIVFTTDHGEMLGDHWMLAKYGYFDQAFHIPLIVRDPSTAADPGRGRTVDDFTENVDVKPTILEWLGCEPPAQCDGLSLLPFCHGETPPDWRQEAHWEYDFRDVADQHPEQALGLTSDQCALGVIRGKRYKYVHCTALPPLFFDLEQDPGEFRNLAQDPAAQPLVLDYAQKMLSWRMNHDERVLANQLLTAKGVVAVKGPRKLVSPRLAP